MDASFYMKNRQELYRSLPEGAIFVIRSGGLVHRTADDYFRFFANRSFVYLTGLDEPDCFLMAYRLHGEVVEMLFIRDPDPAAEIRGGRRIPLEEAGSKSGCADIQHAGSFSQAFHRVANNIWFTELHLVLETHPGQESTDQNRAFHRMAVEKYPNLTIKNAFPRLSLQRTLKSTDEIANITEAMAITREGILRMMKAARLATHEMDLYAEFMQVIHKHRAVESAFKPIVSCGKNNFYLHYDTPSGGLADGELCLADVGAIVDFCCVDISRVFPRNGHFSERQKTVYEAALRVNDEITEAIRPGMPFPLIDQLCREKTFESLQPLGLLDDIADIGRYVWHGCTHHVGFDVHDVGTYHVPIAENMFFTMDTGIYIREWGIGMRIEDNVLVTAEGLKRLSGDIPRTIDDIEAAMA